MLIMNIILILIYCLSLSFQTIKSGLFCDDQIQETYAYDERLGFYKYLQSVKNPADCWNVDYIDLDVDEIKCNPKTISAPINIKRSLKFSDYIESPFKVTYLKISVDKNNQIFTLNNRQLSSNTKFNISSDLEFSYAKSSKINIQFINYGVVLDNTKTS